MSHFVYQIRATRPGFDHEGPNSDEAGVMAAHFEYLKQHFEEGKVVLVGPCLDFAYGLAILETETEEEARRIMENDPAVVQGVMRAEFHPFKLSLLRKN